MKNEDEDPFVRILVSKTTYKPRTGDGTEVIARSNLGKPKISEWRRKKDQGTMSTKKTKKSVKSSKSMVSEMTQSTSRSTPPVLKTMDTKQLELSGVTNSKTVRKNSFSTRRAKVMTTSSRAGSKAVSRTGSRAGSKAVSRADSRTGSRTGSRTESSFRTDRSRDRRAERQRESIQKEKKKQKDLAIKNAKKEEEKRAKEEKVAKKQQEKYAREERKRKDRADKIARKEAEKRAKEEKKQKKLQKRLDKKAQKQIKKELYKENRKHQHGLKRSDSHTSSVFQKINYVSRPYSDNKIYEQSYEDECTKYDSIKSSSDSSNGLLGKIIDGSSRNQYELEDGVPATVSFVSSTELTETNYTVGMNSRDNSRDTIYYEGMEEEIGIMNDMRNAFGFGKAKQNDARDLRMVESDISCSDDDSSASSSGFFFPSGRTLTLKYSV